MAVDITPIFAAYFARNAGPVLGDPDARQVPDYGLAASLDGVLVTLTLAFRAGSAYCCDEWGCHLKLQEGMRWEWLRQELAVRGLVSSERLELRLAAVIEAGARFFDWSRPDPMRRCWYEFAPAEARRYEVVVSEG